MDTDLKFELSVLPLLSIVISKKIKNKPIAVSITITVVKTIPAIFLYKILFHSACYSSNKTPTKLTLQKVTQKKNMEIVLCCEDCLMLPVHLHDSKLNW